MEATWWLNEQLQAWLGEKNAADTLTQSVPHNVTSEMGLALMDVADVIRPYPEVVTFLQHVENDAFLDDIARTLRAGSWRREVAFLTYLDAYGMRCVGEIDLTRPRWSERPSTLVPLLLGNIANFDPGARERVVRAGTAGRLDEGRGAAGVAGGTYRMGSVRPMKPRQMIDRVRTFIGYREYPKYGMVSRYFVYKQALLGEAERLVQARVLCEAEDILKLRFEELREGRADGPGGQPGHPSAAGRDDFVSYQALHTTSGDHFGR